EATKPDRATRRGAYSQSLVRVWLPIALAAIIFAVGYFVGLNSAPRDYRVQLGRSIYGPDFEIKLSGGNQVECLEWASTNFDNATAGLLSLICNGRSMWQP